MLGAFVRVMGVSRKGFPVVQGLRRGRSGGTPACPETLESAEPVEKDYVEKLFAEESAVVRKKCSLPEFRLNGVVGEKLAMFTVATESRVVSLGDSLGDFAVESIGRAGVRLVCGDSVEVRGVGDE
jgi:hypothetical protein